MYQHLLLHFLFFHVRKNDDGPPCRISTACYLCCSSQRNKHIGAGCFVQSGLTSFTLIGVAQLIHYGR